MGGGSLAETAARLGTGAGRASSRGRLRFVMVAAERPFFARLQKVARLVRDRTVAVAYIQGGAKGDIILQTAGVKVGAKIVAQHTSRRLDLEHVLGRELLRTVQPLPNVD
jgi:hypothetical protein